MPLDYSYQKVQNGKRPDQLVWFRRPSVFWLLPVFLLFNLAMGATAMPRMNVLISLICRKVLSSGSAAASQHMAGEAMPQNARRQMMGAGHSMDGAAPGVGMGNSSAVIVIGEHNPQCSVGEVESATAMLTLYGNLIAGILAALLTPVWGKLSDKYGRVKPLAAASTIFLSGEIIAVLIAALPDAFPLNWIYLAYVLEGISGSFVLIMALASSYAADCTTDNERNVALGWFHGSMFFGMATGPIFGGWLGMSGGKSRPLLIFYTALLMRVVAIIFLLVLVPESLPNRQKQLRSPISEIKSIFGTPSHLTLTQRLRAANPLRLLQIFVPDNSSGSSRRTQRNLLVLAVVNTLMFGAVMGAMNVTMLYSEYIFHWGNYESGIFLSAVNFSRTIATIVILPLAIRLFRRFYPSSSPFLPSSHTHTAHSNQPRQPADVQVQEGFTTLDLLLLRTSIVSDILGYAGYALSPTGPLFVLSGVLASLGAIGLATSEASLTKLVPSSQTGELLGALGLLQALARIVAPTVANLTYSVTINRAPTLVFWGIAGSFVIAIAVSLFARPQTGVVDDGDEDGEGGTPLGKMSRDGEDALGSEEMEDWGRVVCGGVR